MLELVASSPGLETLITFRYFRSEFKDCALNLSGIFSLAFCSISWMVMNHCVLASKLLMNWSTELIQGTGSPRVCPLVHGLDEFLVPDVDIIRCGVGDCHSADPMLVQGDQCRTSGDVPVTG